MGTSMCAGALIAQSHTEAGSHWPPGMTVGQAHLPECGTLRPVRQHSCWRAGCVWASQTLPGCQWGACLAYRRPARVLACLWFSHWAGCNSTQNWF